MTEYKSDLLRTLSERGFIHQVSDPAGLDEQAAAGPVTGYIGFDCTARSFHVGNLVSIMMLRWMQKTGNRPLALMGGGTTRVGDPSGPHDVRQLLTYEEPDANTENRRRTFARFIDFGDPPTGASWRTTPSGGAAQLHRLPARCRPAFLGQPHADHGLGPPAPRAPARAYLPRVQLHGAAGLRLRRTVAALRLHLRLGGSDQWGNIVNGIDLGRRMGLPQLYALTSPLITTASGAKMGKTAAGAVWLNGDLVSPYEYWQFWRNTEDADVGRFLKLFTELPLDEVARLAALEGAERNDAKKVLATEATALLHGRRRR